MPELVDNPLVAKLLLLLWNAPDREAGIPVAELPEDLLSDVLLSACEGARLIQFARRNHCWHGTGRYLPTPVCSADGRWLDPVPDPSGRPKLVLEKGWSIAELHKPNRKQAWQAVQEAVNEKVPDEIRLRVQLTYDGSKRASRLALNDGVDEPSAEGNGCNDNNEAARRLLSVYTNGVVDKRYDKAKRVLQNDKLTVDQKLTQIHELLPFPPTASAQQLADLLGVSKTAVINSKWWEEHRKGELDNLVGRRHSVHLQRKNHQDEDRSSEKNN